MSALVRKVNVERSHTVTTTIELLNAIEDLRDDYDDALPTTYVVERLAQTMDDGPVTYSISIREAEPV